MSFQKDIFLIKRLLCFLIVAKNEQVKRAATQIHMKQSNLSTMINQLEAELHLKLFNRNANGVSLTSSGAHIFEIAQEMQKAMSEIKTFAKETHLTGGHLNLWISDGIYSYYISSCLSNFCAKFPDVHLDVISSLKDPESLAQFDLGIVYREPYFNDAVILYKGVLHFNLYASKDYFEKNGIPHNMQDLKENHKICLRSDTNRLCQKERNLFRDAKHIVLHTDSPCVLLDLVKNGIGISFLPSFISDEALLPVLKDEIQIEQPFWIICPYHLKDVPKIRALTEYIKKALEKL